MLRGNGDPEYRRRIREKTEKNQYKTETERHEATDNTKHYEIVRPIYAIYQEYQRHGNEERARKQSDRFWEIAGVAGLWLAAAVGVVAIWIGTNDASEQRGVMRHQLAEMQEARRPWMQGYIQFVGPLMFDKDGARAPISLLIKNSGRSPAKNVWRGARMFAGDGPDTLIFGWEEALCSGIRNSRGGFTVFPNEIPNNTFQVGVDAPEIQNNVTTNGEIILRIIVCIDYAFTFLGERHQTSYIWEIDKKNTLTGFAHIKPSDGAVQPNDLLKLTDPSLPGRTS
jgi:hypothetical protein